MKAARRLAALAAFIVASTVTGGAGDPAHAAASGHFVRTCGVQFCLGSHTFRYTGWNTFDLAFPHTAACPTMAGQLSEQAREVAEAAAAHQSVIRFYLFQDATWNGSYYDYSRVDSLVALARRAGVHLQPVFEDGNPLTVAHDGTCFHPRPSLGSAWYSSGYAHPYAGFPLGYRDYVLNTVRRYRNEPSIMAWMLTAEAVQLDNPCSPAMYGFFATMTNAIRSVDPNHLISSGSPGVGNPGWSGYLGWGHPCPGGTPSKYTTIFSLPNNNFAEWHDYQDPAANVPGPYTPCGMRLSGSPPCDPDGYNIRVAHSVGKPVFVGEMGIVAADPVRAEEYRRKISTAFQDGVAGYIVWQYENRAVPGTDYTKRPVPREDYNFGPSDPVIPVLSELALAESDTGVRGAGSG